jgi:hypothetical protein
MKNTLFFALFAVTFVCMHAVAADLSFNRFDFEIEAVKGGAVEYARQADFNSEEDEFDIDSGTEEAIYHYEYKSPKKAFLFSLLLPGSGQLYSKSSIWKPIAFLGIEAGAWAGYLKFKADGNDLTDDYQAYANQYWIEGDTVGGTPDPQTYRGWLLENYETVDDTGLTDLTHALPSSKTQQYYEMIGKYDQFRAGWVDYWDDTERWNTPRRLEYMTMRGDANDKLHLSDNMLIVVMVNHLLSAVDAAMAAHRFNDSRTDEAWSLNAELRNYSATDEIPIIRFTHKF